MDNSKRRVLTDEKIWQAVLGEMEVLLPQMQFATWYRGTSCVVKDNTITVLTNNPFGRDWIASKHADHILNAVKKVCPDVEKVQIELTKTESLVRQPLTVRVEPKTEPVKPTAAPLPPLKPDYTFENFVVGNNNSFAYAVAQEVADGPGRRHNPFFIYGGVGLGKTHLAQAVGHEVLKKDPDAKVVYVSCETFTNDFISAIASKKTAQFKKNYRDVDVLIVDDIQFLSSKEGSQEEFFHTFNALQQKSRQIILTADKIPQAIPALEGRLASRFGGGMVVDIQPPNFETRMAILSEKCKEKGYLVPDDVLEYIAKNISSNIRELEGALNRLATACQFQGTNPTLQVASEVLRDYVKNTNRAVDSAEVISAVCKHYGVSRDEILSKNRKKELIVPRQVTIYLIREMTHKSLPEIGKIMGGKDHTTIMHSHKKVEDLLKVDLLIKNDIENIRTTLQSVINK